MHIELQGKVAIVTGGASGIGLAVAQGLAAAGAAVVVADLSCEAGETAVAGLQQQGAKAMFVCTDVSKGEDVRRLMERAKAELGGLDVLVNNAGLQFVCPVVDYPEEKWNQLIGVMLTGTFLCTKYALPTMIANGWGRIVNIGSIHAKIASAYKSAYTSAKFGISGFTKVTAIEAAPHGVTVNCVCPSYVWTPLVQNQIAGLAKTHGMPESDVVEKIMLADAPLKHLLNPAEVADLVLFLCSDSAAGITVSDVMIDCGWTAH